MLKNKFLLIKMLAASSMLLTTASMAAIPCMITHDREKSPQYVIPENATECATGESAWDMKTLKSRNTIVMPNTGEIQTSPDFDMGTVLATQLLCPPSTHLKIIYAHQANRQMKDDTCLTGNPHWFLCVMCGK